jgi:hypothetical protein
MATLLCTPEMRLNAKVSDKFSFVRELRRIIFDNPGKSAFFRPCRKMVGAYSEKSKKELLENADDKTLQKYYDVFHATQGALQVGILTKTPMLNLCA